MAKLSERGLLAIHRVIEQKYPLKLKGVQYPNKIKDIVERPYLIVFGHEPYDTVFKKAACLMEGIIRGHAFFDGNKRTGLMATFAYLQNEGIYLALPIDVVKYTVKVASNQDRDEELINKLISEIATWLQQHSATTHRGYARKVIQYTALPALGLLIMLSFGLSKYAEKRVRDWYQLEFHDDYSQKSADNATQLIRNSIKDSIHAIINKSKMKKTT